MKRLKAFVDSFLEFVFGIPISKSKKIEEFTLNDLQKFYCLAFIRFLKDKKVYDKFIIAVKQRRGVGSMTLHGNYAVDAAFVWLDTKEGHAFWGRINSEWELLLSELGKLLLYKNIDMTTLRQLTNCTNPYLQMFINNRKLGT